MRERAALLITTMAVAMLVASGVALAADITCPNIGNLCIGTNKADTMTGTNQDDVMKGRGGGDTMQARGSGDRLFGGGGNDEVSAGSGDDSLIGDSLAGDSLGGGAGDDSLSGEYGDDTYFFSDGWGADRIAEDGEGAGMGTDTLDFSSLPKPLDINLVSNPDRDEVFSVLSQNRLRRGNDRGCWDAEDRVDESCEANLSSTGGVSERPRTQRAYLLNGLLPAEVRILPPPH